MMTDQQAAEFADASVRIAIKAAQAWMRTNHKEAPAEKLAAELQDKVGAAFGPALDDAKAAVDCGLMGIAHQTFAASMGLAGIEAAKAACLA